MKIEVNYRWLALLISMVVLVLVRNHRVALTLYVISFLTIFIGWLFLLPQYAQKAARQFQADLLQLMTGGRPEEVHDLAERQRLIKWGGLGHILDEARGLAYSEQGEHQRGILCFRRALEAAPEDARVRILLNLAHAYLTSEQLDHAEATYRSVLASQGDNMMAEEGLAELTARRASKAREAD